MRSDIDEVRFALSRGRDRLSVADFAVRGDIGLAGAGRTVADALLGGFERRYDLSNGAISIAYSAICSCREFRWARTRLGVAL